MTTHPKKNVAQLVMVAVRKVRRHILEVRPHEGLQDLLILGHREGEVGVLMLRFDLGQRLYIPYTVLSGRWGKTDCLLLQSAQRKGCASG